MIDRLIQQIEWPGRRVEGASDSAREGEEGLTQDPEDEARTQTRPKLLSDEHGPRIRQELDEAHRAVQDLENQAVEILGEHLNPDVTALPQTAEAVKYIAGTHPDYGTDFPEVPESDQLEDGKITSEAFRRAYNIIEHADRLGLGFDLKESVMAGEDNVTPVKPITNPAEAAGEREPRRGKNIPIQQAIEEKERERKMSIWRQLAYAAGGFIIKFVGDFVENVADAIARALSIKIGPFRVSLGKWIAVPLYWIADGLLAIADRILAKALGHNPDEAAPSPNEDRPGRGAVGPEDTKASQRNKQFTRELRTETTEYDPPPRLANEQHNPHGDNYPQAGAGDQILMAAQRVLQSSVDIARGAESEMPAAGIDLFDRARTLKRNLEFHDDMATIWGAPSSEETTEERNMPELSSEPPVVQARQRGRFGRCP